MDTTPDIKTIRADDLFIGSGNTVLLKDSDLVYTVMDQADTLGCIEVMYREEPSSERKYKWVPYSDVVAINHERVQIIP